MKIEEALAVLDNVVSKVTMNRADHMTCLEALKVVQEATATPKESKK